MSFSFLPAAAAAAAAAGPSALLTQEHKASGTICCGGNDVNQAGNKREGLFRKQKNR